MVIVKNPLTAEERERIAATVTAVQKRTKAAFVSAILPISDRYSLFPPVWGAFLAIAALGILALLRPDLTIGTAFLVTALLFVAFTFMLDWLPLRILVVPKSLKHRLASELAHREFAARILASAQHRNGILLFVSLRERYVEIIADRGIHSRVAEGTWDKIVAEFLAAVKAGRLAEGLIAAVESCGAVLQTHFPAEGQSP
ncbi:MAG: TPM domain-containing protein [Alphaproteobacteria bacterium]